KKDIIKKLDEQLQTYRNWLLEITICDPACGSGAFLNQALEFLMQEHAYIDELNAKLFGFSIALKDVSNHILEKNIFGVDINEESVEIAKLSLWLRTAQKGRKLTALNNNIKCGNSLIDDSAIAGDKAFNWKREFPEVFDKGGFDVVIGNPPYLRVQGLRENFEKESQFYEKKYSSATGRFDIYVLFIEKSFQLINIHGDVSFILPHKFMVSDFGEGIRKFLNKNKAINSIVHFGSEMVFADASAYTCIIGLSHNNNLVNYIQIKPSEILFKIPFEQVGYNILDNKKWNFQGGESGGIFEKLGKQPLTVKDVFENISQGVVSVGDDIFLIKGKIIGSKFIGYSEKAGREIELEAEIMKPLLRGENVRRYAPINHEYYVIYPHFEKEGKTQAYQESELKDKYPLVYNYFLPYKEELIEKKIRYKTNPTCWYSLHRSREISLFEQEKIVTPETSLGGNMTIDNCKYYHNTQVYSLIKKDKYNFDNKFLVAILNSNLFWFFLKSTGAVLRGGYFRFKTKYLEPFPLPKENSGEEQRPFIEKVNFIISQTADFKNIQIQFTDLLQSKFNIEKLTRNLECWYELDFKAFLTELKKAKVSLALSEEAEWMKYFNEEKQKALALKSEIEQVDKEIDQMVYVLYGLTEEEIKIVEGSN
ncbi:MAG TPA: TaqI-like C-terminal specificity domain-containing protein, partial [Cytophagaceae bacterium]|nr:TaqI-like C-terminal specificity domain-containing protein [Cytophagaceae bacterium]